MKCDHCYQYSWILYKYKYYDRGQKQQFLCKKCIQIAMTYDYQIIVEPRSPGDFGFIHMSGVYRSPWVEKVLMEEMKDQIKRHVDEIGNIYIIRKMYKPEEFWGL